MKTMLLSFKPDVFENICNGIKIYEHRRVFPDEPVKAYIYVSKPYQVISGIIYLGNKTNLEEWKEKYSYDCDAVKRIDEYLVHHKVVMEIQKVQKTSQISLDEIKHNFPDFLIPQMYYYLDNLPLLEYLNKNLELIGEPFSHDFKDVDSTMICVH